MGNHLYSEVVMATPDIPLHIFTYVTVERDGTHVRILATEPIGTMTFREYLEFQRAVDACAELAIMRDGKVIAYL